jgi:hypothetical protein
VGLLGQQRLVKCDPNVGVSVDFEGMEPLPCLYPALFVSTFTFVLQCQYDSTAVQVPSSSREGPMPPCFLQSTQTMFGGTLPSSLCIVIAGLPSRVRTYK